MNISEFVWEKDLPELLGCSQGACNQWKMRHLKEGVDYTRVKKGKTFQSKWSIAAVEKYRPGTFIKKATITQIPPNTRMLITTEGPIRCKDNSLFNVGMDIEWKPAEDGKKQVTRNPRTKIQF